MAITHIPAIAIVLIHPKHPAIFHLLLLSDACLVVDANAESIFEPQVIALGLDHRVAVGHQGRHDVFRIQPGLGRGEGVVGEADPIAAEGLGGETQLAGLQPPAADGALHQFAVVGRGQIVQLARTDRPEIVDRPRRVELGREAIAALRREALLEGHILDPLIDTGDGGIAGPFLAPQRLPAPAVAARRCGRRWLGLGPVRCRRCFHPHGDPLQLAGQVFAGDIFWRWR